MVAVRIVGSIFVCQFDALYLFLSEVQSQFELSLAQFSPSLFVFCLSDKRFPMIRLTISKGQILILLLAINLLGLGFYTVR